MILFYLLLAIILLFAAFISIKVLQLKSGRERVDREIASAEIQKLSPFGSVKSLSILPMIDFYADRENLETEAGVSYLVSADNTKILLDVGFNAKKTHPSPLLHNMKELGVTPQDLDMIFISHAHLDHVGGMEDQKQKTFSFSRAPVDVPEIPAYTPVSLNPSKHNPKPVAHTINGPTVLKEGIASIGPIPRFLFLMGYTSEHALAVNVEGKGIVIIIGCGHQTIERIIERAQAIFDEPIYAIIGGLHYPVNGGRISLGPINIQHIVGSDQPPWRGLSEKDVKNAITAIERVSPQIVSLSAHDSSDWSIDQFRKAFGDRYVDLKVGKEIII
ncbi:MAG: MBL fold metallo-hydrolase [Desulfobacterales bacterium]|nr:MBL fold metallo-hydrolase [Desulfobacterales bacterium]